MTKKLKMYAVSVMAFKPNDVVLNLPFINDPGESEVVTLVHQLPALIPAYSMEEASEKRENSRLPDGARVKAGIRTRQP